jgi:predicted negative regulator of RcsB-dependent stress response
MDYESEDQQVEALKQWWKENGTSLIVGLAIGFAGIFGWREYSAHTLGQAQQASDLYESISADVQRGSLSSVAHFDQLKNDYSDTPYPVMAALMIASYQNRKGDSAAAIEMLTYARDHAVDDETRFLASARLAALHLERGDHDAARAILEQPYPEAFTARYEELKGDLYNATGNYDAARAAYDKAIGAKGVSNGQLLKLKRDNVGV